MNCNLHFNILASFWHPNISSTGSNTLCYTRECNTRSRDGTEGSRAPQSASVLQASYAGQAGRATAYELNWSRHTPCSQQLYRMDTCARTELAAADVWPSHRPKLSRCAAWATLHNHTKYTPYNAKTGKRKEKRKTNGKEQSSTGWMWSLSAYRANTTQQVHHTMQLLSRASVPRKALPSFSTEHIYICA